jgi:probable HAF family extracellular repeat protein
VVDYGSSTSGTVTFLRTKYGGIIRLGDLPGGGFDSRAKGISADGSIVVGESTSSYSTEAFIWVMILPTVTLKSMVIRNLQSAFSRFQSHRL